MKARATERGHKQAKKGTDSITSRYYRSRGSAASRSRNGNIFKIQPLGALHIQLWRPNLNLTIRSGGTLMHFVMLATYVAVVSAISLFARWHILG